MVPSTGSTYQSTPLVPEVLPSSSPTTPSSGRGPRQHRAGGDLGLAVGLADEVSRTGLVLDGQVGQPPRPPEGDVSGSPGSSDRDVEQVGAHAAAYACRTASRENSPASTPRGRTTPVCFVTSASRKGVPKPR